MDRFALPSVSAKRSIGMDKAHSDFALSQPISHTYAGCTPGSQGSEQKMNQAPIGQAPRPQRSTFLLRGSRLFLLSLPLLLMAACSWLAPADRAMLLWLGTLIQGIGCFLGMFSWTGVSRALSPAIVMLYVIALSWLLFATSGFEHWFIHLAEAILVVVPLGFFALQNLRDSGAVDLRRARALAARLGDRQDWPATLAECKQLPEIREFREALQIDAGPALALLANPKSQVRIAALAALEFRQEWRHNQPEIVLHFLKNVPEPDVKAAAILALANVEDRPMVEAVAEFTRHASPVVRQAANQALLRKADTRWSWVRHAVRNSLADPELATDGAFGQDGTVWSPEAVADLTAWCSEKGVVAIRAAETLGRHYARVLAAKHDAALVQQLRSQVADGRVPPMLRMELARLLEKVNELDDAVLRALMNAVTPASLRLIAVEALLAKGESHDALAALHDLARLPNREIALATADVVQRRLGADLGLVRGQPLPPIASRKAAQVARQLMIWALEQESPGDEPAARAAGLSQSDDGEW
jgi:hypothetical protein